MQRPKPTKPLILELTGENLGFTTSVHNGLYETSLHGFYENLNLDEAVAFAAGSWNMRNSNDSSLPMALATGDIYNVFNAVNKEIFPWLNRHKKISKERRPRYDKLNPFEGKLRQRLERVDPEAVKILVQKLQEPTRIWVPEHEYLGRQRVGTGNNRMMPKPSDHARQVTRFISEYSTEYEPVKPKPKPTQGTLF